MSSVYEDLNFSEPHKWEEKSKIAISIFLTLKKKRIDPDNAAMCLGMPQKKFKDILRGKLENFTSEELSSCLLKLNYISQ